MEKVSCFHSSDVHGAWRQDEGLGDIVIDHHLDGIEPIRFGESDYVVHCNCGEGVCILGVWYGYNRGFHGMGVDLICLAAGAPLDEFPDEGLHFRPNIVLLDQLNVLCLLWMSHNYWVMV